jgi:micrococcal nuclease
MPTLFTILTILSLIAIPLGIIRPQLFRRLHIETRKRAALVFSGTALLSFILVAVTAPETTKHTPSPAQETTAPATQPSSQSSQDEQHAQPSEIALVTYVVDGDTIELENKTRVRLIGIDTPERGEPYFAESWEKLKEFVLNKQVRLEKDVSERDRYGRLLRYVFVGDTFVNLEMVRQGYAHVYTVPPDVKYQEQLLNAEQEARNAKVGLWKPAQTPQTSPTSQATPPSASTYTVPSCANSDCDCKDFKTHNYAQWFHDNYDPTDKHNLDGADNDGIVCESLP